MTRSKRLAVIGFGAAILICAVIVGALVWPRSRVPDLMAHATRLMPLGDARCALPYWDGTGVCLSARPTPTGLPMISRIDITHKNIMILSDLNLKISRLYPHQARYGVLTYDRPDPDSISLDDKWVWIGPFINPVSASDSQVHAISVVDNSTVAVSTTIPIEPVVFWMPDHRHWVEEDRETHWFLHSIRRPRKMHPLPLIIHPTITALAMTFKGNEVVCVKPDGHLLTLTCKEYGMNKIAYFWDVQISDRGVEANSVGVVSVPQRVLPTDFAVSPDGNSLVWWYLHRDHYPATELQGDTQVWMSKIDGSARHEIYCKSGMYDSEIEQFRWTPDGRHLTFSKDYVLYSVPILAP